MDLDSIVEYEDGKYLLTAPLAFPNGPPVPSGFRYDGFSSPKWAAILGFGNTNPYMLYCAAQHDAIYEDWHGLYTNIKRHRADRLLMLNLIACGVDRVHAWLTYEAVHLDGGQYWRSDHGINPD